MTPGMSVPSASVSFTPRRRAQATTTSAPNVDRKAAWISGGISGSASFTATWLKPQLRQSAIVSAAAAASSGPAMADGEEPTADG